MSSDTPSMVEVDCPLCGKRDYKTLYTPWQKDIDPRTVLSASGGVRGTQYVVKCNGCELIYVNPRPAPELVIGGYTEAEDEIYVGAAAGREATFRRCVKLLERHVKPGRVLDVGAAAGFFVKAAKDAGWDAVGVEPCKWLAQYGVERLGVDVQAATLGEAAFPDDSFDVVTMWDVLEHVPEPMEELREVLRILRPGGLLLVNYPDIGTIMAKMAGKNWWFLLSVHLTYFSRGTLKAMVEQAGFTGFRAKPHYQVLSVGHLIKMGGLYLPGVSRVMGRVASALHVSELPMPYYASQTTAVMRKPGGDR